MTEKFISISDDQIRVEQVGGNSGWIYLGISISGKTMGGIKYLQEDWMQEEATLALLTKGEVIELIRTLEKFV